MWLVIEKETVVVLKMTLMPRGRVGWSWRSMRMRRRDWRS